MDKISKLTELFRRLKAEKPEFFSGLSKWSWVLSALSAISLILSLTEVFELPAKWDAVLALFAGLFVGSASTAEATVRNKIKAGIPLDNGDDEDGPGPGGEPPKPPTKP